MSITGLMKGRIEIKLIKTYTEQEDIRWWKKNLIPKSDVKTFNYICLNTHF